MPRIDKNKIIYDQEDFLAGYSLQGGIASGNVVKAGKGFNWGQNITNTRYLGYITTCPSPTSPTDSALVTTPVVASIKAYDVTAGSCDYLLTGSTGTLHVLSTLAVTPVIQNGASYPHAIDHAHTAEIGCDLIAYRHNLLGTLTNSIFYSFRDNTDWDVGCVKNNDNVSIAFDDDFMSTVPATPLAGGYLTYGKDYPHPMAIGTDGNLYIGSGRYLHCYEGTNGTNGTFLANVLTLPSNFVITCFEKQGELLLIGGFYSVKGGFITDGGRAAIFVYNYLDQVISQEIPIDDEYLATLFIWNGQVAGVTTGELGIRGNTRVRVLNGTNFEQVAEFNTLVDPNSNTNFLPAYHGGVDYVAKQLLINCGGTVYAVAMPYDTSKYEVTNPYKVAVGNGSVVSNRGASGIWVSGAGCPFKFVTGFNTGTFETNAATPGFTGYNKARIKGITVFFKGVFANGRTFEGNVITDEGSQTFCSENTLTGDRVKKYLKTTTGVPFNDFTFLYLQLNWTGAGTTEGAIIDRIEIEIEPITI